MTAPTRDDLIQCGWRMWPTWLCALFTRHKPWREYTHGNSDGSGPDLFADGAVCLCGRVIRHYTWR